MMNKAPPGLHALVKQYEDQKEDYQKTAYNETHTRVELVNPLFRLLGWDTNNESGYAEAYKDVVY